MDYLAVVLAAVIVSCNDAYCNTLAATVTEPKDTEFGERNNSYTIENGSSGRFPWESLGLPRHSPTRTEEPKSPANGISSVQTSNRKSRLLGSLAFLAGLSFGGLATAASSTVKTIAKLPQASFTVNLGSPKGTPVFTAYYSPYSLLPYPFLYHGPLGLAPTVDPAKLQTTLHDDLMPQVIGVFDNKRPTIDFAADSGEEYTDEERKPDNGASAGENGADRRAELRAEADRNAEEKTVTRGCKESQRKHGNYFGGSAGERKDLQVDGNQSRQILDPQAANATGADANRTVTNNATMSTTTSRPGMPAPTYHPPYSGNHTGPHHHSHFAGYYYDGHPQDISHVDLTTGTAAHQYHDHSQLNYNPTYERPANFYHDDKYNVYAGPHVNPYLAGSFASDQINEFAGTADFNRLYTSEYQPPYVNGFKPAK